MQLYLIRHAIAEERSSSGRDADRALTREGSAKMKKAAAGLRVLDIRLDVILTSPFRRAAETAEIVSATLRSTKIETLSELASGVDLNRLLAALRPWRRLSAVALVGHQPDLGSLASKILTGSPDACWLGFKKGGVAAIDTEDSGTVLRGRLQWFATAAQLRAIGSTGERLDDAD